MMVENASNIQKDWDHILDQKGGANVRARDMLRLEAGLPLYGNDIDDTTTPYEAGLKFIVKLEKGAPVTGLEALKRQKLEGLRRRLIGFRVTEPKAIARQGYPVFLDGTP